MSQPPVDQPATPAKDTTSSNGTPSNGVASHPPSHTGPDPAAPDPAAPGPAAPGSVSVDRLESGLAILRLGAEQERVVTLTFERMKSLRSAVEALKASPPKGLVITGSGPDMFTAGADLNLIQNVSNPAEAAQLAKEGQDIFSIIESLPCVTVAAISGPCVGGGCELALACKIRIITDHRSSIIGLPEIKLGILPGFGGTQRLPRLVGLPKALDIILAGKTLRPKQALACGLVNEVTTVERLRQRAEEVALGHRPARAIRLRLIDRLLTHTGLGRSIVKKKASAGIARETRGHYPAPPAALNAVLLGLEQGLAVGYRFEAQELGRLIVTPESKSLVRLFFLTETAKALGKPARKDVEHLHAVVVGAGVMGAGIAGSLARNDCHVILKDTSEEALSRGISQIRGTLSKARHLSDTERSFVLNRIETATKDPSSLGNSHFVIEAIFENLEVKQKLLGNLSKLLPPDAIIASNTSSLSISQIASVIDRPERVIGMHFFNPVEKMPLVEIVCGKATGTRAIAIVAALATKLGKFPIVVDDVPGFLVNRILSPYIGEAGFLISEGFGFKEIDQAAERFGMPMGPIRLLDEVGLDVAQHVSEIMVAGYGERMKAPEHARKLLAIGRRGKKTGAGFYDFSDKSATPSDVARAALEINAPAASGPEKPDLAERMILRLVNEAVRCLDEAVAGQPGPEAAAQIDLGTVMGIGFPPFRGGIISYAQSLGAKAILERLETLFRKHGSRFEPSEGIRSRAASGKSFFESI